MQASRLRRPRQDPGPSHTELRQARGTLRTPRAAGFPASLRTSCSWCSDLAVASVLFLGHSFPGQGCRTCYFSFLGGSFLPQPLPSLNAAQALLFRDANPDYLLPRGLSLQLPLPQPGRGRVVSLLEAPSSGFSVNDVPTVVPQSGPWKLSYLGVGLIMARPAAAEADCPVPDPGLRSFAGVRQVLGGQASHSFGDTVRTHSCAVIGAGGDGREGRPQVFQEAVSKRGDQPTVGTTGGSEEPGRGARSGGLSEQQGETVGR